MTRSLTTEATLGATGGAGGARVSCVTCEARRSQREQWKFTGRETHWGFTFLVWTRADGKRWPVRVW